MPPTKGETIYAPQFRDELLSYTHDILVKIHKEMDIDFSELMAVAMPVRRCENKTRLKNKSQRCKSAAVSGSCFCKAHEPEDDDDKLEVEYIMINNKEYLYHSLTNRVYSYGDSPQLIGILDTYGSICLC